ncbi:hypothetical protein CHL76_02255 [Marinococcus halophilus]|uniref:GH18 domain-containing protein n=1 Tax=Marinococcus halophilus TaxID=1371 RepID=A0A510Y1D8_MARHA|nr:hypothetical protein [Marinococcus halophilus]OZT81199.1 hypothetical protein CHL76_02255 [Marinococcus halophilus]GEK57132.1 hypothetical protein MHA01_00370 [Marinococcus halophilus]
MEKNDRRLMTWTWQGAEPDGSYRRSLNQYHDRIYSIGLHEFGIDSDGKIYDYRSEGYYFEADGDSIVHTGQRCPSPIEQDLIDFPDMNWYLQFIIPFQWNTVKTVLANNTTNNEGRLPQDQLILELNEVVNVYNESSDGVPLNIVGVEIDFEGSMTADPNASGYDQRYIQLLERIKNEVCIPNEKKLRINTYGMWGEQLPYYYRFHNYRLFAESEDKNGNATIDEMQCMTYDFHWAGSAAGASTPIWWLTDVCEWIDEIVGRNPNAKLRKENVYVGAAGYGHRWGMHDESVVQRGSTITYLQLLDWQNGRYKHYHRKQEDVDGDGNDETVFVYEPQDYLPFASEEDAESLNEIMYPHVYDLFEPKYAKILEQNNGSSTATKDEYNRLEYITTFSKQQIPTWTNIHEIANTPDNVTGKAFAVNPPDGVSEQSAYSERRKYNKNLDPETLDFGHSVKTVNGQNEVFVGYEFVHPIWTPTSDGSACYQERVPEGVVEYKVNVPASGSYKIVAMTSFSWYDQMTLVGSVNSTSMVIGGENTEEWYPFVLKGSHWFDCGFFELNAGENTISVTGNGSTEQTPIFGFIVCDDFDQNFSGGEIDLPTNLQPLKAKSETDFEEDSEGNVQPPKDAYFPDKLALAAKMLRRDARPVILWEDNFQSYYEDERSYNDDPQPMLQNTTYYRSIERDYRVEGAGSNLDTDADGEPVCFSDARNVGFTTGEWQIALDESNTVVVDYDSSASAQLALSKKWTGNIQVESNIKILRGKMAGIRFMAQEEGSVADGYALRVNLEKEYSFTNTNGQTITGTGVTELVLEDMEYNEETGEWDYTETIVARQPVGNINLGDTVSFMARWIEDECQLSVNGLDVFIEDNETIEGENQTKVFVNNGDVDPTNGKVTLQRQSGSCGIYAWDSHIQSTLFAVSSLDRWETMEKFEVDIDGETREYGRIARSGYDFDHYGYLIYTGMDETETRDQAPSDGGTANTGDDMGSQLSYEPDEVSLDYEITVDEWESWQGSKNVRVRLKDAGVWFGQALIGDRNGMSVLWVGDAESFLRTMNIAVNDYGLKGVGLWTMGYEDPRMFEMIPKVQPKYRS